MQRTKISAKSNDAWRSYLWFTKFSRPLFFRGGGGQNKTYQRYWISVRVQIRCSVAKRRWLNVIGGRSRKLRPNVAFFHLLWTLEDLWVKCLHHVHMFNLDILLTEEWGCSTDCEIKGRQVRRQKQQNRRPSKYTGRPNYIKRTLNN